MVVVVIFTRFAVYVEESVVVGWSDITVYVVVAVVLGWSDRAVVAVETTVGVGNFVILCGIFCTRIAPFMVAFIALVYLTIIFVNSMSLSIWARNVIVG